MAYEEGQRGRDRLPVPAQGFKIPRRQVSQNVDINTPPDNSMRKVSSLARKSLPGKPLPDLMHSPRSTTTQPIIPSINMHEISSAQLEPTLHSTDYQRPPAVRQDSATSKASIRHISSSLDVPDVETINGGSQRTLPIRTSHSRAVSAPLQRVQDPPEIMVQEDVPSEEEPAAPQLQYFHRPVRKPSPRTSQSNLKESRQSPGPRTGETASHLLRSRDSSPALSGSGHPHETTARGRALSPHQRTGSMSNERSVSTGRLSDYRSVSSIDLLNIPYSQQAAQTLALDNAQLQHHVGGSASLLDTRKTLEMYRANAKKTNDQSIQYEFAIFMVNAAREGVPNPDGTISPSPDAEDFLREARQILQRLSDKGYPYAQYYLGDGFFSGLFNRGRPDYEKAWALFVAASKHGHAEAGYRAALCYEFGWGSRRDFNKAVQYFRQSASKGHPGAATRLGKACLIGDMGLVGKGREGVKWLKRAAESADAQHNSAPFELGLLHLTGFEPDVFKDEGYAAQLFTQSADLGHAESAIRMGEAYEHGLLTCPRDSALSLHFYNIAAVAGKPEAMMALCAWYMVGAEPVLDRDEFEAYEWAKRAADLEFPKAEYAIGYFTEMGIGCRRDPLEANVWYVRAAEQGDERAKQRLEIIRAASAGETALPKAEKKKKGTKKKKSTTTAPETPDEVEDKGWLKRRVT